MTALSQLNSIDPSIWSGTKSTEILPNDFNLTMKSGISCDSRFPLNPESNDPRHWMPHDELSAGAFSFYSQPYAEQKEAFIILMESLGISSTIKTFSVYIKKELNGKKQMRIVSAFALRYAYKIINEKEYKSFPEQQVSMAEAMWIFFLDVNPPRKQLYNIKPGEKVISLTAMSPSIGIMVENSHHNIYRIWDRFAISRP